MFTQLLILVAITLFLGIHKIEEGHVGVYYLRGVLQKQLSGPGYNFMLPLINRVESVQVTVQTDKVEDIPCGTSGGVIIHFDKIEVVNQLSRHHVYDVVKAYSVDYDKIWIYDKIHHEINQFCSTHTLHEVLIDKFNTLDESLQAILQQHLKEWIPGVNIISIRVTKPRIPTNIKQQFERMEEQKNNYLIETEKQKTLVQKEQTAQRKLILQAQSDLEITEIEQNKKVKEIESQIATSRIDNLIYLENQKNEADLEYQKNMTSLRNEQQQYSSVYLQDMAMDALTTNLELVLGPNIPNVQIKHQ